MPLFIRDMSRARPLAPEVDVSGMPDGAALVLWALVSNSEHLLVVEDLAQYHRLTASTLHPSPTYVIIKDLTGADTYSLTIATSETP